MNQHSGSTHDPPAPASNHEAQRVDQLSGEGKRREHSESQQEGSRPGDVLQRSSCLLPPQQQHHRAKGDGRSRQSKLRARVTKETTIIETEATTLGNLALVGGRLDSLRRDNKELQPPPQSNITETPRERTAKRAALVIVAPDGREILRIERE